MEVSRILEYLEEGCQLLVGGGGGGGGSRLFHDTVTSITTYCMRRMHNISGGETGC